MKREVKNEENMEVEKEVREEGGKVMIEKEKVGDERKMEDIIEMREII